LGIKIVDEGGIIKAKGTPLGSKIGYFFAVLFFIAGFIMIFSEILGATILLGIGIIIVSASAHHSNKARIKKLKEAGYTPLAGGNRTGKIIAAVIITIVFLVVWNFIAYPIISAPIHKKIDCNDEKLKLLDQASIALDQGDELKADQLQLKVDSMKC
jgi:hypothetical protein